MKYEATTTLYQCGQCDFRSDAMEVAAHEKQHTIEELRAQLAQVTKELDAKDDVIAAWTNQWRDMKAKRDALREQMDADEAEARMYRESVEAERDAANQRADRIATNAREFLKNEYCERHQAQIKQLSFQDFMHLVDFCPLDVKEELEKANQRAAQAEAELKEEKTERNGWYNAWLKSQMEIGELLQRLQANGIRVDGEVTG